MKFCKKIALVFSLVFSFTLLAHPLYESNIDLQCSAEFPCPKSIQNRVEFWVAVFSKYGSDEVIFHDAKLPDRVFSTLKTDIGCIRKNNSNYSIIENERTRIENKLKLLHKKIKKNDPLDEEEKLLLVNFESLDPKEILASAQRVRCQNGNRTRFENGIKVHSQYKNQIVKILQDHNVSLDIQYLPFVESAYNPKAYSRVGAAGLWQIMPATARHLGLQVNAAIDERFDPILATRGAAKYLYNAQEILNTYLSSLGLQKNNQLGPFTITSYNYGVGGAKKMLRNIGLDYGKVLEEYKSRSSGVAVQNFYSSFLAARYVAINRKKYFPHILDSTADFSVANKHVVQLKEMRSAEHIVDFFKLDINEFKELNPVLTHLVIKGRKNIPQGTHIYLPESLNLTPALLEDYWRQPFGNKLLLESKYKVVAGDTACGIAKEFKISCADLISENSLGRRGLIRSGQILTIPGKTETSALSPIAQLKAPKMESQKPSIEPIVQKAAPLADREEDFIGPPLPPKLAAIEEQGPMDASIEEIIHAEGIGESLFIQKEKRNNNMYYSIHVESEETLGHYAEWLQLPNTSSIRVLNKMNKNTIVTDEQIYLPIQEKNAEFMIKRFENLRIEFHESLHDRFNEHYTISQINHYTIKRGDSLLAISKRFSVPQWLIRRFNPEIKHVGLQTGESLKIPALKEKEGQN